MSKTIAILCLAITCAGLSSAPAHSEDPPAASSSEASKIFDEGTARLRKGEYVKAVESYLRCLELLPQSDIRRAVVHDNLGLAYVHQKQMDTAIDHFQKSIAANPKYALSHLHMGAALRGRGDLVPGIAESVIAMRLRPEVAVIHDELWKGYSVAGRLYGYDLELALREVYHIEMLLESGIGDGKRESQILTELSYLIEVIQEIQKQADSSRVRVFSKGTVELTAQEKIELQKRVSEELVLPDDGIDSAEKLKTLEKAKVRVQASR